MSTPTRFDPKARRASVRRTPHERGAWLYIPGEVLREAGIDVDGPTPLYRLWGRGRGSLLVRLYRRVE